MICCNKGMNIYILLIYFFNCSLEVIYGCEQFNTLVHFGDPGKKYFINTGYPKPGDIPLLNRKVFRGKRVHIREHPYIVSIRRDWGHYGVGSLISHNLILTVAHPIFNVPINELGVVVGENYSDRGTSLLTIILILIHEKFDPYTLLADLAILRIYEDILFKHFVKNIQFPIKNGIMGTAIVTGWGRCDFTDGDLCFPRSIKYFPDEIVDPMLRSISIPYRTINNLYCEAYENHLTPVREGMLCIGFAREQNPIAPCLAVPGAALVIGANLRGLLSWGFGCGYVHDLPLVYTDILHYRTWINTNMQIFKRLTREKVTDLFTATKSYILMLWLNKTRIDLPSFDSGKKSLMKTDIDEELIDLAGDLYDIRDFIFNGEYREEKQAMFKNMKQIKSMLTEPQVNKTSVNTDPSVRYNATWDSYEDLF